MIISKETGIPYSTISRWQRELAKDINFNPLDKKWCYHLRIFTDEEEDHIADYIVQNFISTGAYFTDDDFQEVALTVYKEKYLSLINSNDEDSKKVKLRTFTCSQASFK